MTPDTNGITARLEDGKIIVTGLSEEITSRIIANHANSMGELFFDAQIDGDKISVHMNLADNSSEQATTE